MTTSRPSTFALTALTSVWLASMRRLKTNAASTPSTFASDSTHLARPASVQASTKSLIDPVSRCAALVTSDLP